MVAPVITALPTNPSRNDAPDTFVARADAWVAALTPWTTQANALGTWMNSTATQVALDATTASTAATNAGISAAAAAASAASAVSAPGTSATSTTSNSIGTGSKSFTVQTGKSFVPGMWLSIDAGSGNSMVAQIVSYNSGSGALVVTSRVPLGTGTFTSWNLSVSGLPALPGETVVEITTNTAAAAYTTYIVKAGLTLTAPASPAPGDWFEVVNYTAGFASTVNALIINGNSNNINSITDTMTVNYRNVHIRFTYISATIGWAVKL